MTREYYVAIEASMHRFEIHCQSHTAMLRMAAHVSETWQAALAAPEFRGIVQIQGDHGMISISPHVIQHVEPFVRENTPVSYEWTETLSRPTYAEIKEQERRKMELERFWAQKSKPKRRSLLGRLLRRGE